MDQPSYLCSILHMINILKFIKYLYCLVQSFVAVPITSNLEEVQPTTGNVDGHIQCTSLSQGIFLLFFK